MSRKKIQLFLIGAVILATCAASRSEELNYLPKQSETHDHPEVPRISAFEARKLYEQGKLILANAQESKSHENIHIVGAISLPNGDVQHMSIPLPTDVIVAFYCS